MTQKHSTVGVVCMVIGLICFGIAIVKISITGFYPDELVWIAPVGAFGAFMGWLGLKLDGDEEEGRG